MTTAREICVAALQLDGVIAANESGEASDLDVCLKRLNGMLSAWSLLPPNYLSNVIETFSLIAGQGSYTVGVAANFNTAVPLKVLESSFVRYQNVDFALKQITEDEYSQIAYKLSGGIPYCYWYDSGVSAGTLYFYPVPQSSQTFQMHSMKPFTAFADLDTNYVFSAGYAETMTYCLAERIAPMFEREVPKFVAVEAIKLRKALKRSNTAIPTMDIGFVPANTDCYSGVFGGGAGADAIVSTDGEFIVYTP